MPKKYEAPPVKTAVIAVTALAALIAALAVGIKYIKGAAFYYSAAAVIAAAAFALFFASFGARHPSAREFTVLAVMTALAVASRAAFYALPNIKPLAALVVVTAACLGPAPGFLCGSLSMLCSDFIFGQGAWTPFQMLGMGAVGFLCGVILGGGLKKSRAAIAITGAVLTLCVYGLTVDFGSALIFSGTLSLKTLGAFIASGITFNLIHSAVTFVILFAAGPVLVSKLQRIKTKYALFQGRNKAN